MLSKIIAFTPGLVRLNILDIYQGYLENGVEIKNPISNENKDEIFSFPLALSLTD